MGRSSKLLPLVRCIARNTRPCVGLQRAIAAVCQCCIPVRRWPKRRPCLLARLQQTLSDAQYVIMNFMRCVYTKCEALRLFVSLPFPVDCTVSG